MTKLQALTALKEAAEEGRSIWPQQLDGTGLESRPFGNAYNGSLDAAKALHEAVFGEGEGWQVYRTAKRPGMIPGSSRKKFAASVGYGPTAHGYADCPARAWLLAIIAALIKMEGKG